MLSNVRTVCATYVTYVCLKLWGMLFLVSVSVQLQPIVSGIGRQHGIDLTLLNSLVYRMLLYVNIYGSYKLLKPVRFLAHSAEFHVQYFTFMLNLFSALEDSYAHFTRTGLRIYYGVSDNDNNEQFGIQNAILCQHIRELQTFKKQSVVWPILYTIMLRSLWSAYTVQQFNDLALITLLNIVSVNAVLWRLLLYVIVCIPPYVVWTG